MAEWVAWQLFLTCQSGFLRRKMVGKHCWLSNHFVNLVFARTITSGVIHSLLVQYGKLRISETKTNELVLWRAWASYSKSSCLNSVVRQCLTYAYRNRIQGTMCSECSVRLICWISVSALLLLLWVFVKFVAKLHVFRRLAKTFRYYFLSLFCLYTKCIKKFARGNFVSLKRIYR